ILIADNTFQNPPLNFATMVIEHFVANCHRLQHPLICTIRRSYIINCLVGALPSLVDFFISVMGHPAWLYFTKILCRAASSDPTQLKKALRTILLHDVQQLLCMLLFITPFLDQMLTSVTLFLTFIIANMLPRLLRPLTYGLRGQALKKAHEG
ncbi:odorant receptor 135-1, partial [Denticeps clupeoides]|uniref:odorant receptor 135-1 n=1 Tax=Denticeps clupeoides TaxID=299321 RepID=UPI0010A3E557